MKKSAKKKTAPIEENEEQDIKKIVHEVMDKAMDDFKADILALGNE